ncbi:MAG: GNAT family N-acetyltransferase [Thermoprotei archaeon]
MIIETLRESGLTDLELVKYINELLPYDFVDIETYRRVTLNDPNHDKSNMFLFRGSNGYDAIVSIVYLKQIVIPELVNHAWIKLFAVRHDREIVDRVLDWVEDHVKSMNKQVLHIYGYAPFYYTTGIDRRYYNYVKVIEGRGYSIHSRVVNYYVDMYHYSYPPDVYETIKSLVQQGYKIYVANEEEYKEIIEWIKEKFGIVWAIETELTKKYLDSGVVVLRDNKGNIIGFNTFSATSPIRYGPVGVDEKYRGKGYGRVLLHYTLREMRNRGHVIVEIPWTTHLYYYADVPGVFRIRYFLIYEKRLE